MFLGYNTNGFAHHRLEDAIAILAELGYRSIALTLDYHALNPFDPDLPRQLAAVKSLLQERGLRRSSRRARASCSTLTASTSRRCSARRPTATAGSTSSNGP